MRASSLPAATTCLEEGPNFTSSFWTASEELVLDEDSVHTKNTSRYASDFEELSVLEEPNAAEPELAAEAVSLCGAPLRVCHAEGAAFCAIVNVSPLGERLLQGAIRVCKSSQDPVDFHFAIGFLTKWTQGMDLNGLEGGTAVTARFPGLLLEFALHVNEIGRCMGFVVGDAVIPEDEDCTISIRMVLYPSLAKNPPQFISLPTIHGGEILRRVFFIGLPGHCFVCGRKGHVAAACTRRRISPDQRHQALKQEALHANGGLDDRLVRRRSETEKARRKEGRKGRKDDDELGRQRLQSLCIGEEKMFLLSPRILLLLHHLFMIRHLTLRAQNKTTTPEGVTGRKGVEYGVAEEKELGLVQAEMKVRTGWCGRNARVKGYGEAEGYRIWIRDTVRLQEGMGRLQAGIQEGLDRLLTGQERLRADGIGI
ncbi:hypothetical protein L7F22_025055 [Adiantum nelumboides]|nr:hypothetical protein [Adiantum nelumboides]